MRQRFYKECGKHIQLVDDNQRARREKDTYDNGVVFSERPIHVGEVLHLKVEVLEQKWAGSLVSCKRLLSPFLLYKY